MSTSNGTSHDADEQIDSLYAWWPGASPAPAPCPEALFSCTVRGTLDGHETLLTVRGQTPAEFKRNLSEVRGLLDAPAQAPAPPSSQGQGQDSHWCRAHQVAMQENQKNGQRWFSHRLPEGGFCKGRRSPVT